MTGKAGEWKRLEEYSQLNPNSDGTVPYTMGGGMQTNPSILSPVAHSTGWVSESENNLPGLISILNTLMAKVGIQVAQIGIPQRTLNIQVLRQAMLNAPLFGSPENHHFSTWQANLARLYKELSESSGSHGLIHADKGDESFGLAIAVCLSILAADTYPGAMFFAETQTYYTMHPFSFLVFGGLEKHAGLNAIPVDQPQDWERRINCILYPRTEFVNRTRPVIYPFSNKQQLACYSFFNDGDAVFGSEEHRQLWSTTEFLQYVFRVNRKRGLPVDDAVIQQVFQLVTGSNRRYINPESREGLEIMETVRKANRMFASYRSRRNPAKTT